MAPDASQNPATPAQRRERIGRDPDRRGGDQRTSWRGAHCSSGIVQCAGTGRHRPANPDRAATARPLILRRILRMKPKTQQVTKVVQMTLLALSS